MRRTITVVATLIAAVLLAGCLGIGSGDTGRFVIQEDFEEGIADYWDRGTDLPDDPNSNGTVSWDITTTGRMTATGSRSGQFILDGSQDDGTIWLERSIKLTPGRRYRVNVSAQAYSEQESFNVIAHMVQYVGLTPPTREEDFPSPNSKDTAGATAGLRQPLARAAGWDTYQFGWTTPRIEHGNQTIHVAVGLSAVWETEIAWPYDNLEITVTPVGP